MKLLSGLHSSGFDLDRYRYILQMADVLTEKTTISSQSPNVIAFERRSLISENIYNGCNNLRVLYHRASNRYSSSNYGVSLDLSFRLVCNAHSV